jgi:alpha-glucosidase
MSKASKDGECFMAWDKATQMNLREKIENFATDQYAFQKDQEPLYKVVPFYWVKINKPTAFSSIQHLELSFCHERRNVTSFKQKEMNYYFIHGPQMEDVVTSYTDLTENQNYHRCGLLLPPM